MDKDKYNFKKCQCLSDLAYITQVAFCAIFSTLVYFTYSFFLRLETIGVCVSTDSLDLHKHYLAAFFYDSKSMYFE